jgi:hypothetical protein
VHHRIPLGVTPQVARDWPNRFNGHGSVEVADGLPAVCGRMLHGHHRPGALRLLLALPSASGEGHSRRGRVVWVSSRDGKAGANRQRGRERRSDEPLAQRAKRAGYLRDGLGRPPSPPRASPHRDYVDTSAAREIEDLRTDDGAVTRASTGRDAHPGEPSTGPPNG